MLLCRGEALARAKHWLQGRRLAPQHSSCPEVSLLSASTQTGVFLPWLHLNSTVISPIRCYLAALLIAMKGNASFRSPCLPNCPSIISLAEERTSSRARDAQGTHSHTALCPQTRHLGDLAGAVSSKLSQGEQNTLSSSSCPLHRAASQQRLAEKPALGAGQGPAPPAGAASSATLQLPNTKELIKTSHDILLSADNNWGRQLHGAVCSS